MFGHRCLEKVGGLGDRSHKRKRNRRTERVPRDAEGCDALHSGVRGAPAPCAAGRWAPTGCCETGPVPGPAPVASHRGVTVWRDSGGMQV